MADITAQELDPQELATLARIEKDNTALAALIDDLGSWPGARASFPRALPRCSPSMSPSCSPRTSPR